MPFILLIFNVLDVTTFFEVSKVLILKYLVEEIPGLSGCDWGCGGCGGILGRCGCSELNYLDLDIFSFLDDTDNILIMWSG